MLSCVSSRLEWASHLHSEVKKHDKAASSAFKAEWNLRQGSAHLSTGLIAGTAEVVLCLSSLFLPNWVYATFSASSVTMVSATVTMVLLWSIKKRKGWKRRISLWLAGSPWREKTSIALRWNNFSSGQRSQSAPGIHAEPVLTDLTGPKNYMLINLKCLLQVWCLHDAQAADVTSEVSLGDKVEMAG